ncbi:MAG TPA: nucleotidyltransferase family protein [Burkholderiales bacterium]|nr:nucleotidyltransferase family protein [Burkholderiales bacterium]
MKSIVGILLAAGSGSRFGGDKLLASLPDGRAVGLAAYRNLRMALDDVRVVVRARDAKLRAMFEQEGAAIVECADAQLGMSRSLVAGVRSARSGDGWVIALGDMPFVKPATARRIAETILHGAPIALPSYRGERGQPVAFSSRLKEELLAISGDEGARSVVQRHWAQVKIVECDDPGVLRDIDVPEDLRE